LLEKNLLPTHRFSQLRSILLEVTSCLYYTEATNYLSPK
jgi:hypothetical protein